MHLRIVAMLTAVFVSAQSLAATPITAGEFLARAGPLMKKSQITLMFSPEAHRLMRIVGDAAKGLRAQQDADRAAGRRSATCLPPKGKAEIGAEELLGYMNALTPEQKSQAFDTVFRGFAARKYPCRN